MKIARKKHLAVAIAIILVLVSLYLSFNMVMDALVHSDKEVQVPDITGKNVVEAVNILSAGGLA
ncbi:MAG: hypothetical protein LBV66_01615, partial [Elusimicrobiota bacterium]|nr:hypothetical protein [Elusimicrobiota bacterium]